MYLRSNFNPSVNLSISKVSGKEIKLLLCNSSFQLRADLVQLATLINKQLKSTVSFSDLD